MNSFSNYGANHGEHLLRVGGGALGPADSSMVKIGESRMSRIEDDDHSDQVTPIKKQGGDSDSSQYIRTDIKTALRHNEDKNSPTSIITDSMASKVGVGSGALMLGSG